MSTAHAEQPVPRATHHQRMRVVRLSGGFAALLLLLGRLGQTGGGAGTGNPANTIIWVTTLLAVVLLIWRERNQALKHRAVHADYMRFIVAAETSLEPFFVLDSVRDRTGEIVDFRFRYVNSHGEELLGRTREELLSGELGRVFGGTTGESWMAGMVERFRGVVLSGEEWNEEFEVRGGEGRGRWLRHRVVKLGDGVAVTVSDASEIKATEARYRTVSNFSHSVFETAPYAIITMDREGTIQSMNAAAERLTGYDREALAGVSSITLLHEPKELSRRVEGEEAEAGPEGIELITAKASRGEVDEREWTYLRQDGTSLPVHVAISALRDGDGELSGFVAIASDISERKQMMTYLTHMASHDQLTGLPGRTLLRERIAEAIERALLHSRKVAVFVIDFDHFKRMNDSLGHRSGDELLVGLAARMRESLRRSDTLGRLGGDEFVVVMPHFASISDVEKCAKRLVDRVSSTAMVGDLEVNMTASVGVCIYPDFAGDVDSLLERADAAMYAAKESGRNQYQLYSDAMLRASQERLSMDTALRHAIAREEMYLHYQPIVSLTTGRVVGMESLLRWHHPKLGLIPPGTFVPLAEETGQIVPIGEWAFQQSCLQTKLLSKELGTELFLSVNLSPRQFEQSNLLSMIEESLAESGLSPSQLQVELTENTLMINSASNLEKLQRIREMGARVAVDDFGTGFCSFSYLLQYPVDRLKIDQSFILQSATDPNAATVVRTIVAMSHNLGIKVIAEGVETVEHLRFLTQRRCDEGQGFFFARPVAASGFADAVRGIHRAFDERRHTGEMAMLGEVAQDDAGESPGRLSVRQILM
ncbi:MAG: EAL domain-containing protein [Acidobacteriota bacterium]|nr:EAL domain-containing protein [Acidobacteriota bacterium]